MPHKETLDYYSVPSQQSDLSRYRNEIERLPNGPAALAKVVHELILHDMWVARYKITKTEDQNCPAPPTVSYLVEKLIDIKRQNINYKTFEARKPEDRIVSCCREFALLLCALLRAKGTPARTRCGFSRYLAKPEFYEDHWVCEVWNGETWQRIDPQIGEVELNSMQNWARAQSNIPADYKKLLLELDPFDLKETDFIVAGEAWRMLRLNHVNPEIFRLEDNPKKYGADSLGGAWFVRSNLIRDFLALNKIEIVPYAAGLERDKGYWVGWPLMNEVDLLEEGLELFDRMAKLTLSPDENLDEIRKVYKDNLILHPPKEMVGV